MAEITLRVLEGADRGRVFEAMPTPLTIGREEGNSIQLNDDRVSRFHVKIQEDNSRLVLTDLESTNGTKVNGEDIQLRILRFGDTITLGRSVLIYGSREQIASRMRELRSVLRESEKGNGSNADSSSLEFDLDFPLEDSSSSLLHLHPPEIPERLSPAQAAQLSELLEFFHWRLRHLLATVKSASSGGRVTLDYAEWQELLDLQSRLAEYLRCIGDPDATNQAF
jgi:pSer/pThr/pTyr-binding forkhead associated (FHA) protein